MFTNEEKKQFVEEGINEFAINPRFRRMLEWLIDEMDSVYDKRLEKEWKTFWDNCKNPPRPKRKKGIPCKLVFDKKERDKLDKLPKKPPIGTVDSMLGLG